MVIFIPVLIFYKNFKNLYYEQKGDELRTSCVYSTMDRIGYTFGGPSAMEEMW